MSIRHVVAAAALLFAAQAFAQDAAPAASAASATSTAAPAAAASAAATPVAAAKLHPGDAKAGQSKAMVCGACHGADGNSTLAQYPRLAGQNAQYIVRQLKLFKSGKRQNPIMLGMAAPLSEQDMRDIAAWFSEQKPLPGVADVKLAKLGQSLYRGGDASRGIPACMACHGPDGAGNPGAAYPELSSQHADYVEAQLKAWRDGTRWGGDAHAKIMVTIADRLTDADIAALASYVEGLHNAAAGASK